MRFRSSIGPTSAVLAALQPPEASMAKTTKGSSAAKKNKGSSARKLAVKR
jgi:hypothetical protein